jgi:predicted RNA-binding protein with PIN domain
MKKLDFATVTPPVGEKSTDEQTGTIKISLIEAQRGREVRAVYRRDGDRLGSYSFRVVDEEYQECACWDTTEPPVEVIQAVEKYGYHITDAGSRPMEVVDLQYVSHIFDIVSRLNATTSDPLLRAFLSHAQKSLSFGIWELCFRATVVEDHGRDALSSVLTKIWEQILSESGEKSPDLTASEFFNKLVEVAANSGYTVSREFDLENLRSVDRVADTHRFSKHYEDKSTVALNTLEVNSSQKLLAVVLGENHADRYTFDVNDPEQQTCVVQGNGSNKRPPMEVIYKMNTTGYEIENISIPQVDDSKRKQLDDVVDLLEDILESYDETTTTHNLFKNGIEAIKYTAILLSVKQEINKREYLHSLKRVAHTSPIQEVKQLGSHL